MKQIIEYIKINIKFLFMPSYWLLNYSYSKSWDVKLNKLLNKHKFTNINDYTAELDNTIIWITNHPYASFKQFTKNSYCNNRPSRQTIYKAKQLLEYDKYTFRKGNNNKICKYARY